MSQHLRREMAKPRRIPPPREERRSAHDPEVSLTASQMFELVAHDLNQVDEENRETQKQAQNPAAQTGVSQQDISLAGDNCHPLIASLPTIQEDIILCKLSNKAVDEFLMWSKNKEVQVIHFPRTPSPPSQTSVAADVSGQSGSASSDAATGGAHYMQPPQIQVTPPQSTQSQGIPAQVITTDLPPIVIQPPPTPPTLPDFVEPSESESTITPIPAAYQNIPTVPQQHEPSLPSDSTETLHGGDAQSTSSGYLG